MSESASNWLEQPVFADPRSVKQRALLDALLSLTSGHATRCVEYGRMLKAIWPDWQAAESIEDIPWLPVRLFKMMDLKSVPDEQVVKTLVSSGTTGAAVSRIHLDAKTAQAQVRALSRIFSDFAGVKRMPMLVLDNNAFMKDRSKFNARAAGILGFSTFGRDPFYAMDEAMQVDWPGLRDWLARHGEQPVFIFGFTFMVWEYFVRSAERAGIELSFPEGSLLVHGGGWKKMLDQQVDNVEFKARLAKLFGVTRVHNYYGMVEQVGSVFFECERGYLHSPSYADVIFRDLNTLEPLPCGEQGFVQVLSTLPESYPGHSLLTEDFGELVGEDDCQCGRRGKYFLIHGRVKNVEVRGCSDTRQVPSA